MRDIILACMRGSKGPTIPILINQGIDKAFLEPEGQFIIKYMH
jgi:hypothetical protein